MVDLLIDLLITIILFGDSIITAFNEIILVYSVKTKEEGRKGKSWKNIDDAWKGGEDRENLDGNLCMYVCVT